MEQNNRLSAVGHSTLLLPAILAPLNDVTGIWLHEIPVTLEKMYFALKESS